MSRPGSSSDDTIARRAAEWVARRDAGLDAREAAELATWRAADPRHEEAFSRYSTVWRQADRPRESGAAAEFHAALAHRRGARRRKQANAFGAAALLVLAAALGVRLLPRTDHAAPSNATAAQTTLLGPERRQLPDGSVAEYPRGTELTVDYSAGFRRVAFARGEAHFKVAPDAARPFIVSAGGVAVRAVGTEFAVRLDPAHTAVLVTEGKVAVAAADHAAPAATLAYVAAGHAVAVSRSTTTAAPAVLPVSPAEIAERLAWRRQRAEFSAVPLAEVLATVNRHTGMQFFVDDPTLAREPLSGVFSIDDAEEFAQLLDRGFGLAVERTAPDRFALRRRR